VAQALMLSGLLLILIGYWAPWVAHPAAGLVQNGFDLSEFVKFLPQVKDGSEPVIRWLFFLPLTTVALSFGLLANVAPIRRAGWLRWLLLAVSLLLLIILIPPYPYTLDRMLGKEFRERTILASISWAAFLLTLTPLGHRLPRQWTPILLGLLTLVGAVSPVAQFLSVRDALSMVYGHPITIGWGVWLMAAGTLAVIAGAVRGIQRARKKAT